MVQTVSSLFIYACYEWEDKLLTYSIMILKLRALSDYPENLNSFSSKSYTLPIPLLPSTTDAFGFFPIGAHIIPYRFLSVNTCIN